MTKRRDLERLLKANGFVSCGGTNHEKFVHPDGRVAIVPRHKEIANQMAKIILKEAGLEGEQPC